MKYDGKGKMMDAARSPIRVGVLLALARTLPHCGVDGADEFIADSSARPRDRS